jgi:hypothetical protein
MLSDTQYQYMEVWIESGGLMKPDSSASGSSAGVFGRNAPAMMSAAMKRGKRNFFTSVVLKIYSL